MEYTMFKEAMIFGIGMVFDLSGSTAMSRVKLKSWAEGGLS
jgi:hypothetical protein